MSGRILHHRIAATTPGGDPATLSVLRDQARGTITLVSMEAMVQLQPAQWHDLLQCLSFPPALPTDVAPEPAGGAR